MNIRVYFVIFHDRSFVACKSCFVGNRTCFYEYSPFFGWIFLFVVCSLPAESKVKLHSSSKMYRTVNYCFRNWYLLSNQLLESKCLGYTMCLTVGIQRETFLNKNEKEAVQICSPPQISISTKTLNLEHHSPWYNLDQDKNPTEVPMM
jgi:hypothetical protein